MSKVAGVFFVLVFACGASLPALSFPYPCGACFCNGNLPKICPNSGVAVDVRLFPFSR